MKKTMHSRNQRGSALMWGLVILLVMTVIGVAASRMSATDTRIAGNQMMYMLTFEGGDSLLRRSASLWEVLLTASCSNNTADLAANPQLRSCATLTGDDAGVVRARILGVNGSHDDSYSDPAASNGSGVVATGRSSMGTAGACPPFKGIAMSTEMTADTGGLACRLFLNNANAALSGTGARSNLAEGVVKPVPPTP